MTNLILRPPLRRARWVWYVVLMLPSALPAASVTCEWRFLEADDTLNLFFQGHAIGTMVHRVSVDPAAGTVRRRVQVRVVPSADVKGLDTMSITETRDYDADGGLVHAYQVLASRSGTSSWELSRREGWVLAVVAGGVRNEKRIGRVSESLHNSCLVMRGIREGTISSGDAWRDTVYELVSASHVAVVTTCVATPADSGRWILEDFDGLTKRKERWEVDSAGRVLLQEVPPLFVAIRDGRPPGLGKTTERPASVDFMEASRIPSARRPTAREAVCLVVDSSVELSETVAPFYRRTDRGWVLLPQTDRCTTRGSASEGTQVEYTRTTVTMQADDPAIVDLARSLTVRGDGCGTVRAVNEYVYKTIRKRNTVTFSTALETLHAGFGDCGEHSVLAAAILRAAGIPARVVYGLVYLPAKQGYYYHAWVVAYAGGTWVFADPSHGVFPAASDRLPLVVDDTGEEVMRMVKVIARVNVEYIPVSTPERRGRRPRSR